KKIDAASAEAAVDEIRGDDRVPHNQQLPADCARATGWLPNWTVEAFNGEQSPRRLRRCGRVVERDAQRRLAGTTGAVVLRAGHHDDTPGKRLLCSIRIIRNSVSHSGSVCSSSRMMPIARFSWLLELASRASPTS